MKHTANKAVKDAKAAPDETGRKAAQVETGRKAVQGETGRKAVPPAKPKPAQQKTCYQSAYVHQNKCRSVTSSKYGQTDVSDHTKKSQKKFAPRPTSQTIVTEPTPELVHAPVHEGHNGTMTESKHFNLLTQGYVMECANVQKLNSVTTLERFWSLY